MTRTALVTTALPYANGPLHLGHLVGYIQGDIWTRAQRMAGHTVHFVCADDTHGTPIMLAAEKAGVTPEAFIAGIQASHERDFAAFGVAFDHYDSTHSPRNRVITERIYAALHAGGHIAERADWGNNNSAVAIDGSPYRIARTTSASPARINRAASPMAWTLAANPAGSRFTQT